MGFDCLNFYKYACILSPGPLGIRHTHDADRERPPAPLKYPSARGRVMEGIGMSGRVVRVGGTDVTVRRCGLGWEAYSLEPELYCRGRTAEDALGFYEFCLSECRPVRRRHKHLGLPSGSI